MSEDTPKELYSIFELDGVEYKTLLSKKFRNRKKYVKWDPKKVIAQIPGTIVKVLVRRGRKVETGDNLLIIEAMKMQSYVQANVAGKVKKIHVKKGQMVQKDFIMIELE
jgi:biotin carboxyl carrier protein